MTDQSGKEISISALTVRGLALLDLLLSALADCPTECSAVASHLARLKLWSGNLGAHRPSGTQSLAYRLRDSSSIRNYVVSLLQGLCVSADEGLIFGCCPPTNLVA